MEIQTEIKKEQPIIANTQFVWQKTLEQSNPIIQGLENGLYTIMQNAINLTSNSNIPQLKNTKPLDSFNKLIENYFIRAYVYNNEGYGEEFKEIGGLDFDDFDSHSVSFGYHENETLIGSVRIVLDNRQIGLPSDKYCPEVEQVRKKFKIAEGSRMVVLPEYQKKSPQIALSLLMACREFSKLNGIERVIYSGAEHIYNMYQKRLAPQEIHSDNVKYGALDQKIICASWNPTQTYPRFDELCARADRR